MEHELHITVLPTDPVVRVVQAEIVDAPQSVRPTISGKLLNVPLPDLMKFDSGENVTVYFNGRRYKFSWLERDGAFELHRD
jgi:hypothetical protein